MLICAGLMQCATAFAQSASPPATATSPIEASTSIPSIPPLACDLEKQKSLRIKKVADAENLLLSDDSEYRTGVLAADLDDPVMRAALEHLVSLPVTIYQTRSDGNGPDRYGRITGQAVIQVGSNQVWLQAKLVSDGLALVNPDKTAKSCIKAQLDLENEARANSRGHWQTGIFKVFSASAPKKILDHLNRFTIAEGKVVRSSRSHNRIYLNFGRNWKQDLTVKIPARLLKTKRARLSGSKTSARLDQNAANLLKPGSHVRVRGWVKDRNGPMIEIESLDQIEILE